MIKSMTGFGAATRENENLRAKVEIKSLNSKFMDLSLRFPKELNDREGEIRNMVTQLLERGKINLNIELTYKNEQPTKVRINQELLKAYYDSLNEAANNLGAQQQDLFRLAIGMPKVMDSAEESVLPEQDWELIKSALAAAFEACTTFRLEEGNVLAKQFEACLSIIERGLGIVIEHDPRRIEQVKTRIRQHLDEAVGAEQVDKSRFEQELIYYIEKLDITEEKVRLKKHIDYFRSILNQAETSGKKLGFLGQELGREINTIGSKCNDADIQREVIAMKEELEKIKEQVLNIL